MSGPLVPSGPVPAQSRMYHFYLAVASSALRPGSDSTLFTMCRSGSMAIGCSLFRLSVSIGDH